LLAEALGTLILVATVVGSGIMAQHMAAGNDAVALLGNTLATAATLYVLISILGPISGAHFNPVVTLLLGKRADKLAYIVVQFIGAVGGTLLAHAMFAVPLIQAGSHIRTGPALWLGEVVATFGLILTIMLGARYRLAQVQLLVAAWITAGYWFTSSTSFANPAVTLARALTNSFSGIRMIDVPGFIIAQYIGGGLGFLVSRVLLKDDQ
ncbi:MAG: aquaporin family protein, partial [Alphaproteobacteria bacterium]|nr:aquaporin family protein [Alphaproteobacteria bacterium]